MTGYSAKQVADIAGASYPNILYWLRSGLIRASESPERKIRQRHEARFSFDDVLEVCIIEELRRRGAPVKRIRAALDYLKGLGPEFMSLFRLGAALPPELRKRTVYLDASGDDIHVHRSDREAFSAVKSQGQQIFIYALMVNVPRLKEQVEHRISTAGWETVAAGSGRA